MATLVTGERVGDGLKALHPTRHETVTQTPYKGKGGLPSKSVSDVAYQRFLRGIAAVALRVAGEEDSTTAGDEPAAEPDGREGRYVGSSTLSI